MNLSTLKVALIGPLPPPFGGMANQMNQLAGLLKKDGVQVEVVQVNAPYRSAAIAKIRGLRAVLRLFPYMFSLWRAAGRADLFHVMANSGWSWFLFAAPAIHAARIRGVPVIVHYHGGEAEAFFQRSFRWVKMSLSMANRVVVPSEYLVEIFSRYKIEAAIVPNIFDRAQYDAEEESRESGDKTYPTIFVARNLERIYGIDVLITAFTSVLEKFPTARLLIAGSGGEESALKSQCAASGISDAVTFTGKIKNSQIISYYRRADVFVNPSRADNLPISILEAFSFGVPVVTTDVGGIPSFVTHEQTGLLVPANDPRKMADAINRVLEDKKLARELICAGQQQMDAYSWPAVKEKLMHNYASVLGAADKI